MISCNQLILYHPDFINVVSNPPMECIKYTIIVKVNNFNEIIVL